ncbi:MAG TPA: class I SAM-dependent methyltransferase [Actinomycetota bacterium]|nr:class I SAM-dependent methyltransferase [Actinomycetota bacterium]
MRAPASRFFEVAYEGRPTWDIGRPQRAVVRLAREGAIVGSVLDAGCGTGEHALFLAARGHEVLGIDLVPAAIARARAKARARRSSARFLVHDALRAAELGRTFDTVLDVGLFHSLDEAGRAALPDAYRAVLPVGGRCVLLCWSERNPWGYGPRAVAREEIGAAFARGWRALRVEPSELESLTPGWRVHAWLAVLFAA